MCSVIVNSKVINENSKLLKCKIQMFVTTKHFNCKTLCFQENIRVKILFHLQNISLN